MTGRKWNGREGRRDWRDIREEKGEEIRGKWLEGGWGEGHNTVVQCSIMDDSAFLWEHAIFGPRPAVTP
jgi:hypothetical protein